MAAPGGQPIDIEKLRADLLKLPKDDPLRIEARRMGLIEREFSEAGPRADFGENALLRLERFWEGLNAPALAGGAIGVKAGSLAGPGGALAGGILGTVGGLGLSYLFDVGGADEEEVARISRQIDETAPEGFWANVALEALEMAPMGVEFLVGGKMVKSGIEQTAKILYTSAAVKRAQDAARKGNLIEGAVDLVDDQKAGIIASAGKRWDRLMQGMKQGVLGKSPEEIAQMKSIQTLMASLTTGGAFGYSAVVREATAEDAIKEFFVGTAVGGLGRLARGVGGAEDAIKLADSTAKFGVSGRRIAAEAGQTFGEATALLAAGSAAHGLEISPEHFAEVLATIATLRVTHNLLGTSAAKFSEKSDPWRKALQQIHLAPGLNRLLMDRVPARERDQAVEQVIQFVDKNMPELREFMRGSEELGTKRGEAAKARARGEAAVVEGEAAPPRDVGDTRGFSGKARVRELSREELGDLGKRLENLDNALSKSAGRDDPKVQALQQAVRAMQERLARSPKTLERLDAEIQGKWPEVAPIRGRGTPEGVLTISMNARQLGETFRAAERELGGKDQAIPPQVAETVRSAMRVLGETTASVDFGRQTESAVGRQILNRAATRLEKAANEIDAYLFTRGVRLRTELGEGRPESQQGKSLRLKRSPEVGKRLERELRAAKTSEDIQRALDNAMRSPQFPRYLRALHEALRAEGGLEVRGRDSVEPVLTMQLSLSADAVTGLRLGSGFGLTDAYLGRLAEVAPHRARVEVAVPVEAVVARFGTGQPNRYLIDLARVREFKVLQEPGVIGERMMDRIDRYHGTVSSLISQVMLHPIQSMMSSKELIASYKRTYGEAKWKEALAAHDRIVQSMKYLSRGHTLGLTVTQLARQFGPRIRQFDQWLKLITGTTMDPKDSYQGTRMGVISWANKLSDQLKQLEGPIWNRSDQGRHLLMVMEAESIQSHLGRRKRDLGGQISQLQDGLKDKSLSLKDRRQMEADLSFLRYERDELLPPAEKRAAEVLSTSGPRLSPEAKRIQFQLTAFHRWSVDSSHPRIKEMEKQWLDSGEKGPLIPPEIRELPTMQTLRRQSLDERYRDDPELLKSKLEELDRQVEALIENPYFPGTRNGKYLVVARVKGLSRNLQDKGVVAVMAADTKARAETYQKVLDRQMKRTYVKAGFDVTVGISDPTLLKAEGNANRSLNILVVDQIRQRSETSEARLVEEMEALGPLKDAATSQRRRLIQGELDQLREARRNMEEAFSEFQPDTAFYNHMKPKDWVSGYDRENLVALQANYSMHLANHLARAIWEPRFAEVLASLRSDIKITASQYGVREVRSAQTEEAVGRVDVRTRVDKPAEKDRGQTVFMDHVELERAYSYLRQHMDFMFQPGRDFAALKGAAFSFYFWFLPKQILVNLAQVPMVAFPAMSERFGARVSAQELQSAGRVLMRGFSAPNKRVLNQFKWEWEFVEAGRQQQFLQESLAMNLAMDADHGALSIYGLKSPMKRGFMRVVKAGTRWFEWSEQYNRHVTFIATIRAESKRLYNEARSAGEKRPFEEWIANRPENEAHRNAIFAAGRDLVDRSMFEYSRWNQAQFMRGWRSPFLLFMSFTQNMLRFWWQDPAAARFMLGLGVVAGMSGMPFAEDFMRVSRVIMQGFHPNHRVDPERDWAELMHEFLGDDLGQMWMHGLSGSGMEPLTTMLQSALTGVPIDDVDPVASLPDLSRSLGFGRITFGLELWADILLAKAIRLVGGAEVPIDGDQMYRSLVMGGIDALGPAFGQIANMGLAIADSDRPDAWKKMQRLVPPSIRQVMRGVQYIPDGSMPEPIEEFLNGLMGPYTRGGERDRSGVRIYETTGLEAVLTALLGQPADLNRAWQERGWVKDAFYFWQTRKRILLDHRAYFHRNRDFGGVREVDRKIREFNRVWGGIHPHLRISEKTKRESIEQREALRIKAEQHGGRTRAEQLIYRNF